MIDSALFEQAEQELANGRYASAYECYRALLVERVPRIRNAVTFRLADVIAMERLAELSVLFGKLRAASSLLASIQAVFTEAGNVYAADYAAVKQASVETSSGDLPRAEAILEGLQPRIAPLATINASRGALAEWERQCIWPDTSPTDRQVLLVRLFLELGRLAAAKGQYRIAIAVLERALSLCGSGSPELAAETRPALTLALAAARMERGDLVGAETAMNEPLGAQSRLLVDVRAHTLRAKLHLLRGNLGAAHPSLERALDLCEDSGFSQAAAATALNLAYVLIYLNQTAEAERWIERAAARASEFEDFSLQRRAQGAMRLARARGQSLADCVAIAPSVSALWNASVNPLDAGTAEEMFDHRSEPGESLLDLFEERSVTFHWLLGRHDWNACERFLQQIQRVFAGTDSMLLEARLMFLEGLLRYYQGRFPDAENALREAESAATELGLILDLWQTQRVLSWTLERAGKRDQATSRRTSSDDLLATIAESLGPSERAIFRLNKWSAEEESLAAEIDALLRQQAAFDRVPRWRRFWGKWRLWRRALSLMHRIDDYKAFIARRGLSLGNAPSSPLISWWRLALAMGSRQAALRFVVLPDRVLTLVLARSCLRAGMHPLSRVALRQKVAAYHECLKDPDRQHLARRALSDLAEALQIESAVAALPRAVRRLTVLADDSLHGLPFAALPCGKNLLSERFVLSLGFEFTIHRPAKRRNADRAFLLALPDGDGCLPPLPGALTEAAIFEDWCRNEELELQRGDPAAGPATLCEQIGRAADVHIVSHGVFRPDEPDQSGFVLTSPVGRLGILTIRDLAHADLTAVDQAVLTSCWGADNFVLPGRFVISLPETLWRAGARTVVACLWEVADDAAAPFVRAFYSNLQTMRRDEALRETQRQCRASVLPDCPLADTSDPYFWAGFQVFGDCSVRHSAAKER